MTLSTAEISDRLEISDVLVRYGTAMDHRDWGLLATCFLPDVAMDYDTSGSFHSLEEFVVHAEEGLRKMRSTQHYVVNHVISVEGDTADATSYALAQHVDDATGAIFSLGGVYRDTLVRTEAGWRISSRRFVSRWNQGVLRPNEVFH
jgi:hypothetical protein